MIQWQVKWCVANGGYCNRTVKTSDLEIVVSLLKDIGATDVVVYPVFM